MMKEQNSISTTLASVPLSLQFLHSPHQFKLACLFTFSIYNKVSHGVSYNQSKMHQRQLIGLHQILFVLAAFSVLKHVRKKIQFDLEFSCFLFQSSVMYENKKICFHVSPARNHTNVLNIHLSFRHSCFWLSFWVFYECINTSVGC